MSRGSGRVEEGRPARPTARAASSWRGGELTLAGVSCRPALARASSSLAQRVGWAARRADQVGSGKCSALFSVSLLFIYFCSVF